jgi:RNA polymerase sigma-70 factor (ECF subfamily)
MPKNPELRRQFEECIDACADSLYRVAFRLTGNETLARELVQETYLNAWQGLESLTNRNRMRSWMFSILRNQYTKLLGREAKAGIATENLEPMVETADSRPSDFADVVQNAISQLSDLHKLPLLLVAMEGISVDEAASILELPRGTVLSRLHRGRQKLKEILKQHQIRF